MTTKQQQPQQQQQHQRKRHTSNLKEKVFQIRNSPLTDRFENSEDVRTIYNLFAVILIGLLTNTVIYDYTRNHTLHFGFRIIITTFNKIPLVLLIWSGFYLAVCLCYVCFGIWARIRTLLFPKLLKGWDGVWIGALICYYLSSLFAVQKIVYYCQLSTGSSTILFLEQIRLVMKVHSFVRSTAPRVLKFKPHSDQYLDVPSGQKFLYFTFVPTLIYRDEYPRTQSVRWKKVIYYFLEVACTIWLLSLIFERFLIPIYEDFCLRKFTKSEIIISVIGNSFPGILILLVGFYACLHCFQNAFAEMLMFGDRLFYREWWLSRSLSDYFRTWNVIVQDWLYTYVYKDVYETVVPKNKLVANLTIFILSAVVHEWVVTNVLGFFFPVQFLQFFIAGAFLNILNLLHLPIGNLFVWYFIVLGCGIQVNMYTLEFFARRNCPIANETLVDFLLPRSFTCNCIQ